jgi:hypothetical protein
VGGDGGLTGFFLFSLHQAEGVVFRNGISIYRLIVFACEFSQLHLATLNVARLSSPLHLF